MSKWNICSKGVNDTGTDSRFIRKIYLSSLFPNIIAVLGGTVNVFFDGILVGRRLGDMGLAAVNQSLPIYLILCTIGSLFASGSAFLSSIAFGDSKREEGQRLFRASMMSSFFVSVIFCALGFSFSDEIAKLVSTVETYEYVLTYIRITLLGGVFKVLLYIPFFYLRLEGKNKRSATAMLIMTLLNIILDYVFLFVKNYGIAGAAWASVIATAVACILLFIFLFTDHSNFKFGLAVFNKSDWLKVMKFGSPMAFNNLLSSARVLVLNTILKSVGGSALISVFAVVNNMNEFSICLQNGVPQTASAMTGIFFGEKDSGSVKKLLNTQIVTGCILSLIFGGITAAFSGVIGKLFGSQENCTVALLCFALSLVFATMNSVLSYYYNGTSRIKLANLITGCRIFFYSALLCVFLSKSGNAVWLFFPLSEITTLLTVLLIGKLISKRGENISDFYLLDESFEKSGTTTSFSVECVDEQICSASDRIRDFCEENGFNSKKTMAISLAIEEILTIISQKSLNSQGTMDVRVIKSGEFGIMRVRSGGKRYNPIEEQNGDLDYMGVQMITKMATKTEYFSTLGVNTLIIYL